MEVLQYVIAFLLVHATAGVSVREDYAPGYTPEGTDSQDAYVEANEGLDSVGEYELVDSDMLMEESARQQLYGETTVTKRGAVKNLAKLWPGKLVPYEISDSLKKNTEADDAIKAAMAEIEKKSCIKFKEREDGEEDYIIFVNEAGCWSHVGKRTGRQPISLSTSGCQVKRIAVHEIMHALGFLHEQSRPDRNAHVVVLYENIKPGTGTQFKMYSSEVINSLGEDYDYNSVMHYQNKDYSANNKDTLQKIGDISYRLGQYSADGGLTESDAKQLNLLYSCPPKPTPGGTTTTSPATTSSTTTSSTTTVSTTTSSTTTAPTTTSSTTTVSTTTSPTTTASTATSSTTSATTTTTEEPYCGWRCLLRRWLERVNRRIRFRRRSSRRRLSATTSPTTTSSTTTSPATRRRRWFGRRRRRRGWGWGKKKDAMKDHTQQKRKDEEKNSVLAKVLSELEEDEEIDEENDKMKDNAEELEQVEGYEDEDDKIDGDHGGEIEQINDNDDEDGQKNNDKENESLPKMTPAEEAEFVKEIEKAVEEKLNIGT